MRVAKNLTRAVAALALTAGVAQAQIVGTFNGGGSLQATGAPGVGAPVHLAFVPAGNNITAVQLLDGIFSGISAGDQGNVQDLDVGVGPRSISDFITISGYSFSLNFIVPGDFNDGGACLFVPAASGQSCTPPNTPFNLTNLSNGHGGFNTSASFSVNGFVTDPDGDSFAYNGIFTSQVPNKTYQQLVSDIDAGRTVPISYSLTIEATALATPEPATFALMGAGLLCLAGVIRVRRSQV